MAAVSCPCCREVVRLPSIELPSDSYVQCPWCSEILPACQWIAKLPPLATVLDSTGKVLPLGRRIAASQGREQDLPHELIASETVDLFEESSDRDISLGEIQGSEEFDDEVDLDGDIIIEESPYQPGLSMPGDEDFPTEITVHQPTLDEIEDAWDEADDAWDSQEIKVGSKDHPSSNSTVVDETPGGGVKDDSAGTEASEMILSEHSNVAAEDSSPDDVPVRSEAVGEPGTSGISSDSQIIKRSDLGDEAMSWGRSAHSSNTLEIGSAEAGATTTSLEKFAGDLVRQSSPHGLEDESAELADRLHRRTSRRRVVGDRQAPLPEDQSSFFKRNDWGRRSSRAIRYLKLASPSLIALPILVVVLYMSGFNPESLHEHPGSGARVADAAPPRMGRSSGISSRDDHSSKLVGDQLVPAGRVLVEADQETTDSSRSFDSPDREPTEPMTRQHVVDLFTPAADPGSPSAVGDRDETFARVEPVNDDVDQILQGLRAERPVVATERDSLESSTAISSGKTVLMRAREHSAQRQSQQDSAKPETGKNAATIEQPVLRFPTEIPSVSEIIQTSAQAELPPSSDIPSSDIPSSDIPSSDIPSSAVMPIEGLAQTSPIGIDGGEAVSAIGAEVANEVIEQYDVLLEQASVVVTGASKRRDKKPHEETVRDPCPDEATTSSRCESPDLVVACDEALHSLDELTLFDREGREAFLARLKAFRDLSQIGSFSLPPDSPSVTGVLDRLVDPERLEPRDLASLADLCSAWIGWKKRATEGILLIGHIEQSGDHRMFELADGTRLELEAVGNEAAAADADVPESGRVIAVARIISKTAPQRVRLMAHVALPSSR